MRTANSHDTHHTFNPSFTLRHVQPMSWTQSHHVLPCVRRYVGRLKSNGRVFDKTDKKPFAFRLGEW